VQEQDSLFAVVHSLRSEVVVPGIAKYEHRGSIIYRVDWSHQGLIVGMFSLRPQGGVEKYLACIIQMIRLGMNVAYSSFMSPSLS